MFPGALGLADSAISEGQGNSEQETVGPESGVTGACRGPPLSAPLEAETTNWTSKHKRHCEQM